MVAAACSSEHVFPNVFSNKTLRILMDLESFRFRLPPTEFCPVFPVALEKHELRPVGLGSEE
jgi:hypothetical protein